MKNKIIHSELTVTFKDIEQYRSFVGWLAAEEVFFDFSTEKVWLQTTEVYQVTLHDLPWANNLKRVAKYLRTIDEPNP